MSPEEQTAITITAIAYEMSARDFVGGVHRALDAGASRELILRDYAATVLEDMHPAVMAGFIATLALMLAEEERRGRS